VCVVGLSSPLPAHATLSPAAARTFTAGLPHVNYSLPMAPLFDSVAHLTQGFAAASQSPYRAAMQGVSGQTVYAIDPASHPVSTAARFAASIVAASAVSEPLLPQKPGSIFNTESQTMNDAVVSPASGASSQSLLSAPQPAWNRVSGHTAPAHPYAGLPADFAAGTGGSNRFAGKSSGAGEPPPAHSGSRPNTNNRGTPYQTKEYTPALVVQQPHLPSQAQNTARRDSSHAAYPTGEQSNPPTAHLHLQRPGDDLMQKLLQTYGTQRSLERIQMSTGNAGRASVSTYSNSPPVAALPSVSAGRTAGQVYVDPLRGQRTGATVAYSPYGINSPIAYASSVTYPVPAADNGMEDLNYDDVSSPEGMGLQEAAAAAAAGPYQQIDAGSSAGKVLSHNLPCSTQRPPSAAIGRPTHDPTIQAQADSTTRPKKSSGGSRGNRAVQGDSSSDRGARRNRSNSARSRGSKGKIDDDESGVSGTVPSVQELNSYGTPAYAQLLPAEFGSTGPSYLSADSFPQYRVAADPYQLTECMLAASRPDVSQRLSTGDGSGRAETSAQQEAQVFMTNMFGNTFVNPNELLTVDQIAFVDPSDAVGYTIQSLQKQENQKPRPIIDEEFGHLSTDPTLGTEQASAVGPPCPGSSDAAAADDVAKQSVADTKKVDPGFLDSFMHFVQGKKPETLASVSTSTITKKPVLPKYIPEPPRPKPPPPPPVTVTTSSSASSSSVKQPSSSSSLKQPSLSSSSMKQPQFTAPKTSVVAATTAATAVASAAVRPKNNKITVQFSDDEDDEPLAFRRAKLSSMVNRAITSLDAISNNTPSGPSANRNSGKRIGRPPKNTGNTGSIQKPMTPASKLASKPKETPKPGDMKTRKTPKQARGKMAEVEPMTDDDEDVMLVESMATRQKSSRKAKEKTVQKQRSYPQPMRKRQYNYLNVYHHRHHCLSSAMHGQSINFPVCVSVSVCVSVTLSVNSPTDQTPQRIFTVDSLTDADLCKDVPFGGLDDE